MRRTLSVLAVTAALLVPAAAASAATPATHGLGTNASCSNGKGGNTHEAEYNGMGNTLKAASCVDVDEIAAPPPPPSGPIG